MRGGYRNPKASFQFTSLTDPFSDATNAVDGGFSAVVGRIPAYYILDFSLSWTYRWLKLEGSVNNVTNTTIRDAPRVTPAPEFCPPTVARFF